MMYTDDDVLYNYRDALLQCRLEQLILSTTCTYHEHHVEVLMTAQTKLEVSTVVSLNTEWSITLQPKGNVPFGPFALCVHVSIPLQLLQSCGIPCLHWQ